MHENDFFFLCFLLYVRENVLVIHLSTAITFIFSMIIIRSCKSSIFINFDSNFLVLYIKAQS